MRVIIRCAGDGTRWGDYQGVPKHLVPICGEPVLHRTVRLINEITPDADVKVVVPDLSDRRYLVPGSSRTVDKPTPANGDIDKIASSAHLWAKDRTVLLWGDTWWTRQALTGVLTADHDTWHAWLRVGPDNTGGEIFAFAWPATINPLIDDAIGRVIDAHHAGQLDTAGHNHRPLRGGWALYRALAGVDWGARGNLGHSTVVDDWTEDMDTPRDWDEWCLRYAQTDPTTREEMTR